MLVHKIGNPVSKESKTKSRNQQTPTGGAQETRSTVRMPEETSGPGRANPLESTIKDYLDPSSPVNLPRLNAPLNSKCIFTQSNASSRDLIEVGTETVREYKKYMQAPVAFRETLVKWRKTQISSQLQNMASGSSDQRVLLQLEHDFLGTLPFYGSLKKKVMRPLLNMQVG